MYARAILKPPSPFREEPPYFASAVGLSENSGSDTKKKFRLGELFCGPGGLALGAVSAAAGNGE
ncbi:MAG: hypothetical protein LBG73_07140, partial [Spirochaetaceae bacterium]|nr:hypothetical protein [Spirochaetaceae bacterium]